MKPCYVAILPLLMALVMPAAAVELQPAPGTDAVKGDAAPPWAAGGGVRDIHVGRAGAQRAGTAGTRAAAQPGRGRIQPVGARGAYFESTTPSVAE